MNRPPLGLRTTSWALVLAGALQVPAIRAAAHCDTLDGPVVTEARKALETADVTPVLKWIAPDDESMIRDAFKKTLAVRGKGAEAKALADQWFFETLVRVHRAAEGVPFTGLLPAGTEVEPGIKVADESLETGSVDVVVKEIQKAAEEGIRERFETVRKAKAHAAESVEAGRTYVAAYVDYIHYVEAVHQTLGGKGAAAHEHAAAAQPVHENSAAAAPGRASERESAAEPKKEK